MNMLTAPLIGAVERFRSVETWVFDLDNTLYPPDSALWPMIDARITLFLCALFGLDGISARALQKHYYRQYGGTLRGLMQEYGIPSDEFLEFVHDIDRSSLKPNPLLAEAIAALPGRKLIFTNGSRAHAMRTAEGLGLAAMFEDIFDIVAAEFVPKPDPSSYDRFFLRHEVDPTRAAMFEDIARNLIVPHARGMLTTLVVPRAGQTDYREAADGTLGSDAYIDFITSDLEGFLRSVQAAIGSERVEARAVS